MTDIAKKEKICRSCFWHKHKNGKNICQRSAPRFSCRDWSNKDELKMCANCRFFNDFDECDSKNADNVCMSWESVQTKALEVQKHFAEIIPDKQEIRQMLKEGQTPLSISEKLGVQLTTLETPLNIDDNQIKILKHHLNTVFAVLPAAELKARTEPGQSSIAALTSLIGTSRELLDDINNRQDPNEQYARLTAEIMEPLTTAFLEVLIKNIDELKSRTREITVSDKIGIHEQTVNLTLKNIASEMQTTLEKHLNTLKDILGVVQ